MIPIYEPTLAMSAILRLCYGQNGTSSATQHPRNVNSLTFSSEWFSAAEKSDQSMRGFVSFTQRIL